MLRDTLPGLQRVAFLGSTQDSATRIFIEQLEAAARVQRLKLQLMLIGGAGEFETAADTMLRERAQAVIVQPLFTLGQSGPLAEVLARRKLPSISALRPFAIAGGLMAYGPSRADTFRRIASFVDRVLKGAAPGQSAGGRAHHLRAGVQPGHRPGVGVTVSQAMRLRADEVIE
ncbi:MAG: hypothetical protein IPP44_00105 [Ideonella sp.]|nr:hypothetical protein [Ideonella sp.]